MRRPAVPALLAFCGLYGPLSASEEEHLPWREVRIVCPEREGTGRVVFSAETDGRNYESVRVEAFGKAFEAERPHLDALAGFPLSGLVTTHEAGHPETGGHTVHFRFERHGYESDGRLVERVVTLSVSRARGLVSSGPHERTLVPSPAEEADRSDAEGRDAGADEFGKRVVEPRAGEPEVTARQALDAAERYVGDRKIDVSQHHLDSVVLRDDTRFAAFGQGLKTVVTKFWVVTYRPDRFVGKGFEIYLHVDMDGNVRRFHPN